MSNESSERCSQPRLQEEGKRGRVTTRKDEIGNNERRLVRIKCTIHFVECFLNFRRITRSSIDKEVLAVCSGSASPNDEPRYQALNTNLITVNQISVGCHMEDIPCCEQTSVCLCFPVAVVRTFRSPLQNEGLNPQHYPNFWVPIKMRQQTSEIVIRQCEEPLSYDCLRD